MGRLLILCGLLLNLAAYITSKGIFQCELNCENKYDDESDSHSILCDIQSGKKLCEIPVDEISNRTYCDTTPSCNVELTLTCTGDFKIVFQNTLRFSTAMMAALEIVNCSVDLESVGVFVKETYILLLSLEYWKTSKNDEDSPTEIIPSDEENKGQLHGLKSVVMLQVVYKGYRKPIPSVLRTKRWPMLLYLALGNAIVGNSDWQALKLSMPMLQFLHIFESDLLSIPDFPWSPKTISIPENHTVNNDAYEFMIATWEKDSSLYVRSLVLEENNIHNVSYIRLKGSVYHISLSENQLYHFDNDTFSNVDELEYLDLSFNQLVLFPAGSFKELSSLIVLDLSHNHLKLVTRNHFLGLKNLKYLILDHNNLVRVVSGCFSPLKSLKAIDLSYNLIKEIANDAITSELDKVSGVVLSYNNITHFPQWVFTMKNLTHVDMSNNHLTFDMLIKDLDSFSQQLLHIQNMSVEEFTKNTGQSEPIHVTTVDLRQNLFSTLNFTKIQLSNDRFNLFQYLLSYFQLNMQENDINCDCSNLDLHRYLLEERFRREQQDYTQPHIVSENFELWQCMRPESVKYVPIVDVPEETFTCHVDLEHCPLSCTCFIFDESVRVNCSNRNISHFPEALPTGAIMLNLSKNSLTSVLDIPYDQSLEIIDLSQNLIGSIDDTAVASFNLMKIVFLHDNALSYLPHTFTSLQNVKLTLHGNFLVCDCHLKWISRWVKAYNSNIYDVEQITCASGLPKAEIVLYADENQFVCKISRDKLIAIPLGIAVVIIVVFILLMYKFRDEIKVLLYFHFKFHPFDRSDDSDIHDKLYDAFVSYNQQDTEWVMDTLCPVLEGQEKQYRLHIHHRDFLPGGLIVENIYNGVQCSRRMILVLTHSFLGSEWCRLEFRAAHDYVLNHRSNYLIIIMLDDINLDELDEDMKLYLCTNTYIDGRNRLFLQRLLYAMPEKPLALLQHDQPPAHELVQL